MRDQTSTITTLKRKTHVINQISMNVSIINENIF